MLQVLFCGFLLLLGFGRGCWPLNGKACFLVPNEVLNPASCLHLEHLGRPKPGQARQKSQSSISAKVCPFENIHNTGTQTPTLHKMKARQKASRVGPFSLHKETIVCLYTPSLPGLVFLYSIKQKGKRKATWQRWSLHAVNKRRMLSLLISIPGHSPVCEESSTNTQKVPKETGCEFCVLFTK